MTGWPPMAMRPAVGGLIRAMAVSRVDLPEPLGPNRPTISPRARLQGRIAHRHHRGVTLPIDLAQVIDLDGGCFDGGRAHAASTVLGSTLRAFQMPSRLARVEMAMTMRPSATRSSFSISTSRGKCGNR